MARIYAAYRRDNPHPDVERVLEGLAHVHGATAIVSAPSIATGATYRTVVENQIRECVGVVIIAGPEFNTEPDALGRRRLDNPDDLFRIEIESALKISKMMVVVALVGGYFLPDAKLLPRSLRPLTRRGVMNMGAHESFENDQNLLNAAVRRMLDGSARRTVRCLIVVLLLFTVVSLIAVVLATIAANTASPLP
ncbi:MAG: hypothetical protein IPK52_09455 [Chloroflexi bacterium]|nr:hypothetical protein [Chloroflexota bacterium]